MDYFEAKTKGIIREGIVLLLYDLQQSESIKKTENPYVAVEANELNHKALNDAVDTIYQDLKLKGFAK